MWEATDSVAPSPDLERKSSLVDPNMAASAGRVKSCKETLALLTLSLLAVVKMASASMLLPQAKRAHSL